MNQIVEAAWWKRTLARLIDVVIVFGLTFILFIFAIYPNTFDKDKYIENQNKISEEYSRSDLFLKSTKGSLTSKGGYSAISHINDLTSITLKLDGEEFKDVNITKSLDYFYTQMYSTYNKQTNLSFDVFKKQVLQVKEEKSNIKDLLRSGTDYSNYSYQYQLIDNSDAGQYKSVLFVLDCFSKAVDEVSKSETVLLLDNENRSLMLSSIVLFIPTLVGFSLIFDLIIPLFTSGGKSLGKLIFKLEIISKDGYKLKKYKLILRWLSYIIFDIFLGALTFLGTVLISYTMMIFNKRKMSVMDYVASTRVVDDLTTILFSNVEEENYYKSRMGLNDL